MGELIAIIAGVGAAIYVLMLGAVMAYFALAAYVIARWRAFREGTPPDPQLGAKTAFGWFRVLSCQVVLLGLTLFVYAVMTKSAESTRSDLYRTAAGLLVPGSLVYAAHWWFGRLTNERQFPVIGRLFSGLNLILAGLTGFTALVAAFVLLFQKNADVEAHRFAWSTVLVYVTAWISMGVSFFRASAPAAPAAGSWAGAPQGPGTPPPAGQAPPAETPR
jgi:hypothetical protein